MTEAAARLVVLDTTRGVPVAELEISGDADDCERMARIATRAGALFSTR